MSKLALFDLDGTLISTQGVGMRAMAAAGNGLWGEKFHFEDVVSAGALDPLLFRVAAERCGIECTPQNEERFRNAYCKALTEQLKGCLANGSVRVLPGVVELLQQVHFHPHVTLGLLTGNYRLTGPVKLRAAELDPAMFVVTAFGDEAPA
jgi:phosphoglycolate phosphatase-like HAD superfamily hydrolase